MTILETNLARIFKRSRSSHSRTVGCLFHDQRVLRLDEPPEVNALAPYALKFHYAAFVQHIPEEERASGVDARSIVVVDLSRRPSKNRPHEAVTVGGAGFDEQSLYAVKRIVLTRQASIGWSEIGQGGGRGLRGQVFAQVGAVRRLLSEAPGLDLQSLRLCGHGRAFCWREDGAPKSAVVDR